MSRGPALLSIHSVDNFGEEGVLADAAVCSELECLPISVATSILITGARGVEALQGLSLSLVAQQFESSLSQCQPTVARTGILCGERQVRLIAELVRESSVEDLVVAPVVRIRGTSILDPDTLEVMRGELFPAARVLVVRAGDLQLLAGETATDVEGMKRAAVSLRSQGAPSVLIVGVVTRGRVLDLLDEEGHIGLFDASRVDAPRVPGLSGAHAAALSCHLARGHSLRQAVDAAQRYVAFRLQRGR